MNNLKKNKSDLEFTSSLLVNKEFMSKYKLLDKNIRKHVRPIIFDNLDKPYKKINKIRKLLKPADIANIEEVIHLSEYDNILPDLFPNSPQILQKEYFLASIPIDKHLNLLNLTVKKQFSKLKSLIILILKLNDYILSKKYNEAEILIEEIISKYGYSHLLIRKIILLSELSKLGNIELSFIDTFINEFNSHGENQVLSSLQQCYDVEMSFFNLKKSIMNISDSEYYINIMLRVPFLYKNYTYDKSDFDTPLKYSIQSSLVDGLLFLMRNHDAYSYENYHYIKAVIDLFKDSDKNIENLAEFYLNNYTIDTEDIFFQQSSAWYEIIGMEDYRVLQDLFVDDPNSDYLSVEKNIDKLSDNINHLINKYNLFDLLDSRKYFQNNGSHLQSLVNKGAITRSAIFNYTISINKENIIFDQNDLYWIMGNTRELPRSIDYKTLRKIAKNTDDLECKIIYYLLIHKQSKSERDNHTLRKLLEKVVIEDFDGDLVKFIDYQYSKSKEVAQFTYITCTVDFIAKLTHIIKNTFLITETRARLHKWMGEITNEKAYFERARTLIIDHQINKVRNELDDYRIYVDSQRLNEWISDEIIREFTAVLSSIEKAGLTEYHDSPQLFFLVERVYKEFCSNNIYGISSYLGRRIRHGTFKGTMFNSVVSHMEREYKINNSKYNPIWEKWKNEYDCIIEDIITNYLHIESSDKPLGLIKPNTNNLEKQTIVTACIKNLMLSFFTHGSNIQLNNLLIEYCWRLIEVDLKNVNQYLNTTQSKVLLLTNAPIVAYNQDFLNSFYKNLKEIVRENFSTVLEWFKRPQSVAPKAEVALLIKAVISEVESAGVRLNYNDEQLVSNLVLFGGAYHVVYDALYVIMSNVAIHGDSEKKLDILIKFDETNKKIIISISSYILSNESEININERLKPPKDIDIMKAQTYEGKSGIPKLYHLENTDTNFSIEELVSMDSKVRVTVSYKVM